MKFVRREFGEAAHVADSPDSLDRARIRAPHLERETETESGAVTSQAVGNVPERIMRDEVGFQLGSSSREERIESSLRTNTVANVS